uniref:Endonuclease/exonuclease/phosphatase domain-containing protein n=1 Tax=Timema cristinae TaxID=61476 RepID=A0A7R9CMS3_TIMCR|nr:unnamed protein product [Timema cristinae]
MHLCIAIGPLSVGITRTVDAVDMEDEFDEDGEFADLASIIHDNGLSSIVDRRIIDYGKLALPLYRDFVVLERRGEYTKHAYDDVNDAFKQSLQSECRVALLTHWISLDPLANLGFQVPASLAGFYCEQISIVGEGYFYTPSTSDIGHKLKLNCVPKNGDQEGPQSEVISSTSVGAGPGMCPFEKRHVFTKERLPSKNFRVVSYNILADLYADSEVARTQLYPYCPSYALSIDYRKQLILRELLGIECCVVCSGYNADLICLQEVDSKIFDLDLTPVLGYVGYEGVFHRKGGTVSEGVACLFHKSKFRLLDTKSVVLAEELKTNSLFSDIWKKIEKNGALAERFLARTTCLQCTILESVEDPREQVIVGNTHLYFHPNADHIRLLQGGMTIIYLEDIFAKLLSMSTDKRVSMVVCGDFNSTPECGVYQLFTTQFVPENCIDWKSKEDEAMNELSLSHSLLLGSAYGTPAFTNFTAGFAGCLDYIFYQIDQLEITQVCAAYGLSQYLYSSHYQFSRPIIAAYTFRLGQEQHPLIHYIENLLISCFLFQVVPLPSIEDVTEHTALPSVVFPSDHVALVADLRWKPF